MRSFIPRQLKVKEDTIAIRLECEVIDDLKLYSEYLESSQNYVVCQVLRKAFRKDRDFASWRAQRGSIDGTFPVKNKKARTKPVQPKREAAVA